MILKSTVECFPRFCFVVKRSADNMISQIFDIFSHDFSLFSTQLTLFRSKSSIGLKKDWIHVRKCQKFAKSSCRPMFSQQNKTLQNIPLCSCLILPPNIFAEKGSFLDFLGSNPLLKTHTKCLFCSFQIFDLGQNLEFSQGIFFFHTSLSLFWICARNFAPLTNFYTKKMTSGTSRGQHFS